VFSHEATTDCYCNHEKKAKKRNTPTLYGACRQPNTDNYFCAMSPIDCGNPKVTSYVWIDPVEVKQQLGIQCTCDKVHIGACIDAENDYKAHCAVSEDSCEGGSQFSRYVHPLQAIGWWGIHCRLCAAKTDSDDEAFFTKVAKDRSVFLRQHSNNKGLVIGLSVLSGVLALLLFVAGFALFHGKSTTKYKVTKNTDENVTAEEDLIS